MSGRQKLDLSDNTARGAALDLLIQESARGAPPAPPPWSSPGTDAEPSSVSSCTGRVWKVANQLRVMAQYTSILSDAASSSYFLLGSPSTCVEGLEWFCNFAHPVHPLSLQEYQKVNDYLAACAKASGVTVQRACFNVHRAVVKPERNLTQVLLEQHFSGPFVQYELDVCAYMLADPNLTYEGWISGFPAWRQSGLYYPLALASVYMPGSHSWLPEEVHESRLAQAFGICLTSLNRPTEVEYHAQALHNLADAWSTDTTGTSDLLAGILDRLAVLMGVKSNGVPGKEGSFDLLCRLRDFTSEIRLCENAHEQNFRAWHALKGAVERAFPPTLLSAPLVQPKRETWGYPRLTLAVDFPPGAAPVVHFAEKTLGHVKPDNGSSAAYTYSPPFVKECMLHQTSQRIQDVLWRLGELVLSPDLAVCIYQPRLALATLGLNPTADPQTRLPEAKHVLAHLDSCAAPAEMTNDYVAFTDTLCGLVPPIYTHYFPHPCTILMWRLDTPPRAIMFTGPSEELVDPYAQSHHHLPKVLVNCKVPHRPIGGIVKVPYNSCEETLRGCLKSFAAEGLASHPANTVLLAQLDGKGHRAPGEQVAPATCTTLAESVACFALTRPAKVSVCNLGESCAWKEDGIDPRYAEKQLADNGFRYRDWTAMHVGKSTQQSRLASHLLRAECVHTTMLPWIQPDETVKWVRMSSSVSPDHVVTLQGKSLRHAVESRFIHDLRMLPVDPGYVTERQNCEVYTDPAGGVGIAYAPTGGHSIQFVHFEPV